MMKVYTIYVATNTVNGKQYVGFDSNWPKRRQSHKDESNNPRSHTYKTMFHNAIRKHGWESFLWQPIYQSIDKDHTLSIMEQFFIEQLRTHVSFDDCNGYNLTLGGEGQLGRKMSPETKLKKSKALSGKPNRQSRTFSTPHGTFECITQAVKCLSLHPRTVIARLHNPNMVQWFYLDAPKQAILKPRTGSSNQISTPHGAFDSIRECNKQTGIPISTITDRIKSTGWTDWFATGVTRKRTARSIVTPHGKFDSIAIASVSLQISTSTIAAKLRSTKNTQWYYY